MKIRLPIATFALAAAIVAAYFLLSGGLLYIDSGTLGSYSLGAGSPAYAAFTHLFVHVGINHLVGNLVPLLIFGVILEPLLGGGLTLLVFFASGILSSLVFVLFNPGYSLVGASAGVSGVIGAAAISKPRASLLLLLVLPAFLYALVFPIVHDAISYGESHLAQRQFDLEASAVRLNASNRTGEAFVYVRQAQEAREQLVISTEGRQRESATPSDLLVHVIGAIVGVFIVVALRRDLVERGSLEFSEVGARLAGFVKRK